MKTATFALVSSFITLFPWVFSQAYAVTAKESCLLIFLNASSIEDSIRDTAHAIVNSSKPSGNRAAKILLANLNKQISSFDGQIANCGNSTVAREMSGHASNEAVLLGELLQVYSSERVDVAQFKAKPLFVKMHKEMMAIRSNLAILNAQNQAETQNLRLGPSKAAIQFYSTCKSLRDLLQDYPETLNKYFIDGDSAAKSKFVAQADKAALLSAEVVRLGHLCGCTAESAEIAKLAHSISSNYSKTLANNQNPSEGHRVYKYCPEHQTLEKLMASLRQKISAIVAGAVHKSVADD